MKINVIGTSGSGKSTLARRIASQLNIPYIEMDLLYWRPNWQGTPKEEFYARLTQALSQPDWVLDGNYDRSRDIKWRDVDIVVWVDYGFWHTLRQVTLRAIARARSQQELWPETGNRESLRRAFLSRDSIIFWMLKTWRRNRQRYGEYMVDPRYQHLRFVRISTPQQADEFLATLP
ncbi:AAA family ATPase [Kosakonia oryzendophytica]|uniref:AAA family ATPase n=1 Tax=Kosakonia oryzendophytica TaxID=1005665 RepID=UPI003D32F3BB